MLSVRVSLSQSAPKYCHCESVVVLDLSLYGVCVWVIMSACVLTL